MHGHFYADVAASVLIFATSALGADTNEFVLLKHRARRDAYEWRISEARILKTPEWRADARKIPIPPDKAVRIAKAWFEKRGRDLDELVGIEIRPFAVEISNESQKGLQRRFYYVITCLPSGLAFNSMKVVVLMDGSVVEPREIPTKDDTE